QDRGGMLVVPVVEDRREDVDVAARGALEEVAGDERAVLTQACLVAVRLGQLEDDPAQPGVPVEEADEQRTVAAADVDHELVAAPAEHGETFHRRVVPFGHRGDAPRTEEHTSELQSRGPLGWRPLLGKKKRRIHMLFLTISLLILNYN